LGDPGIIGSPTEVCISQGSAVICPVHHIGKGISSPFIHGEKIIDNDILCSSFCVNLNAKIFTNPL
jgi:hypothetical protein